MQFTKLVLASALAAGMASSAHATNWLQLQGTEPAGSSDRFKLWGFVQPQYTYTENTKLKAGPWSGQKAVFNQTAPERTSSNTFQIRRARVGVRGSNFPLDSRTNYFVLLEGGKNGITEFGDSAVAFTDASVTLNHIPHARVRIGQFKYPGSEEGLQAIHVFDYINFTNFTDQMLLERFLDEDGSRPNFVNDQTGSVGAFRDIGIQVFDWFNWLGWEHSYAFMVGNGNGLNRTDNNNEKDFYAYWASEKIFGGKGARREGWKMYAWGQHGERTLEYSFGNQVDRDFDRDRWGIGTTFRKGKYRAAAEYMWADGMIFNGSDGGAPPGALNNAGTTVAGLNIRPNGESQGYYVHLGYAVTPKIELDVRYDFLDRMENVDADQREWTTLTVGAQYFFNKKTRALINYEFRDLDAPDFSSSAPPNEIGDSIDDRITVQLLAIF